MDEQIRKALHAQAEEVTLPPDAWERQKALLGRPPAWSRWAAAMVLPAALALFLAVAVLGGLGPRGGTPGGGTPDGGTPDGGTPDGGTPDGGTPDGGDPAAPGQSGSGPDTGAPVRPGADPQTLGQPAADPAAFRGQGRLAFTWNGELWILDGTAGELRRVEGPAPAAAPSWSADGRWLAFIQAGADSGRLLVADAATGRAQAVTGLPDGAATGSFAWSPAGSTLAVTAAGSTLAVTAAGSRGPADGASGLWLVDNPAEPRARLLAPTEAPAGSLAWSPDGTRLAYVMTLPFTDPVTRSDALEVIPAAGGEPARWYVAEGADIQPAGWWPDGQGVLFWSSPSHSASIAADGLPLMSLAAGAAAPQPLATTLVFSGWLSPAPGGRDLLLVRGSGRAVWDGKALAVCDVTGAGCRDLPSVAGLVDLDPAVSPDGSRIALVRAQARPGEMGFATEEQLDEWVDSRALWLAGPDGAGAREVAAAGRGIYSPAWSGDGQHIVYVRDNALWILDLERMAAARLVGPFPDPPDRFGYYGHVNWWSRGLAWHREGPGGGPGG